MRHTDGEPSPFEIIANELGDLGFVVYYEDGFHVLNTGHGLRGCTRIFLFLLFVVLPAALKDATRLHFWLARSSTAREHSKIVGRIGNPTYIIAEPITLSCLRQVARRGHVCATRQTSAGRLSRPSDRATGHVHACGVRSADPRP